MFKKSKPTSAIEQRIDMIVKKVVYHDRAVKDELLEDIRHLAESEKILAEAEKLRADAKREKIDPNVIIKSIGTVVGVVIMANYEKTRIIPQKAFQLFVKHM